jgi:hypothetical protein
MPCPLSGLRQIDAAQKQHEFFVAENDFASLALGADSDDVNGLFRRDVNIVGAKRRW